MLLEFTVNNFRSIKDDATFSMLATTREDDMNSFPVQIGTEELYVLNSAVIYGANASGRVILFDRWA